MLKEIGTCPICEKPLLCAPGQVIRFHRECRTAGRKRFGKATGVKAFEIDGAGMLTPKVVVG